jgi:hypothetical protein
MGLGPLTDVSPGEARKLAQEFRIERDQGRDPIEARSQRKTENFIEALLRTRVKLDPKTTPELTHLYRHYDVTGQLLYVGVAQSTHNRLQQRRKQTSWFPLTALIAIDDYPTRASAEAAEARAIVEEAPIYNRVVRLNLHKSNLKD